MSVIWKKQLPKRVRLENWWSDIGWKICFWIGAILFLCSIIFGTMWCDSRVCLAKWENFGPRWGFFKGCQIKVNGKWVSTSNIRITNCGEKYTLEALGE